MKHSFNFKFAQNKSVAHKAQFSFFPTLLSLTFFMRRFYFLLLFLLMCSFQLCAQYELIATDSLMHMLKHQYAAISKNKIDVVFEMLARGLPGQPVFDSLENGLIADAEAAATAS